MIEKKRIEKIFLDPEPCYECDGLSSKLGTKLGIRCYWKHIKLLYLLPVFEQTNYKSYIIFYKIKSNKYANE